MTTPRDRDEVRRVDLTRGRTVLLTGGGQTGIASPTLHPGQAAALVDAHFDEETEVSLNVQQTGGNLAAIISIVYWIGQAQFALPTFTASQAEPDTIRLACRAVRVTAQVSGTGTATVSGGVVEGDVNPLAEGIPPAWVMPGTVGQSDTPNTGAGKLLSVSGSCANLNGATALWLFVCDAAALAITTVTMTAKGSGYTSVPVVSFSGGGQSTTAQNAYSGSATALMGVETADITITGGGSGYTGSEAVTFSKPPAGGQQATGTIVQAGGVVTGITILTPGSGYLTPPTITIAPPTSGTTATATCTLSVESVTVNDGGAGFVSAPGVVFTGGGGGSGAAANAAVSSSQGIVPALMITQTGQFGFSDELRVKGKFTRGATWVLSTTQGSITLAAAPASVRCDLGVG